MRPHTLTASGFFLSASLVAFLAASPSLASNTNVSLHVAPESSGPSPSPAVPSSSSFPYSNQPYYGVDESASAPKLVVPTDSNTGGGSILFCPPGADLDGDSKVDIKDLSILLSAWGFVGSSCSDVNRDGRVDTIDFSVLLSAWTIPFKNF